MAMIRGKVSINNLNRANTGVFGAPTGLRFLDGQLVDSNGAKVETEKLKSRFEKIRNKKTLDQVCGQQKN